MKSDLTIKFFTDYERDLLFKIIEEEKQMAATPYTYKCAIRNEAMFKLMYYCALRVSEVSLIEKSNYNSLNKEIYCKRLKGGLNNTLQIIDHKILTALNRHLRENKPQTNIFENMRSNQVSHLSRKTMDSLMRKYCRKSNGEITPDKWHCHVLRHTRAINLADAGLDIREIQYWLGHADITNTQIYLQFTAKHQERLYSKLKKAKKNSLI